MEFWPDPNLSIVLPGGCSCSCDFCFGAMDAEPPPDYLDRLRHVLKYLPSEFWQISVTGGEPTDSPWLSKALYAIDRERWRKVVLTTNGGTVRGRYPSFDHIWDCVDHVNISRHEIRDGNNRSVFGTAEIIGADALRDQIVAFNKNGIDASMACVIDARTSENFITRYIEAAKSWGASACCFRKRCEPGSTLDPLKVEDSFDDHDAVSATDCPVCRSKTQLIDGMRVTWKASVMEPEEGLDVPYELIFQPDGTLTTDWAGKHVVTVTEDGEIMACNAEDKAMESALDRILGKLDAMERRLQLVEGRRLTAEPITWPAVNSGVGDVACWASGALPSVKSGHPAVGRGMGQCGGGGGGGRC